MRACKTFAALAALALPTVSTAEQIGTIPDPAGLVLPSLDGSAPAVAREGWKHFYFHKPGVSYAQAYADFADCYRFLPVENTRGKLPMFVPWVDRQAARVVTPVPMYGLVGLAIGAMVEGPLVRRAHQSRMRRCMEPRGYIRYPLPEDSWKALTDNYSVRSTALQAKAASMAAPKSQPVTD
jgi:hypothetical protein